MLTLMRTLWPAKGCIIDAMIQNGTHQRYTSLRVRELIKWTYTRPAITTANPAHGHGIAHRADERHVEEEGWWGRLCWRHERVGHPQTPRPDESATQRGAGSARSQTRRTDPSLRSQPKR